VKNTHLPREKNIKQKKAGEESLQKREDWNMHEPLRCVEGKSAPVLK
jgi:hypothetical protein